MNGRHALVTGASGFVGSNLIRTLLARGFRVTALLRPSSKPWRLYDVLDRIDVRNGTLDDPHSLASIPAAEFNDLVFHAAAAGIRPGDDPATVEKANIGGTANLLDRIESAGGCRRLVFISSCSVYGDAAGATENAPLRGDTVYASTKIAGETMVKERGIPSVILRLYTPYGPYEASYRLVAGTILAAQRGSDIACTAGSQRRDLIYIDDAVEAIIAAGLKPGIEGEVLNVSTGVSTTVREAVQTILKVTGSTARADFGALPYRQNEVWEMSGDPALMQERLGITNPRPLEDGLELTARWFEKHEKLYRENA